MNFIGFHFEMTKKLSIVVPVFFNAGSLPRLFEELDALRIALRTKEVQLQLIFVDDGSKDQSISVLRDYKEKAPDITVVKLTRNFGAVHCSKVGLSYVTGDAFMILAADLQDPPSLIIDMFQSWLNGSKFVICERITRGDPLMSRLYSKVYYRLVRTFVIKNYPLGGYDMALMDRALLPPLVNSAKSVFTPLLAYWLGYDPVVIKYHRPARVHGKSGWTFVKKFNSFLDVMLGFSIMPIRLISSVGAVVAMSSFVYGGVVVASALTRRIPVEGFATVVALITFLLGLVLLMLGLIGEYLWRIFDETNKRPEAVIEEVW